MAIAGPPRRYRAILLLVAAFSLPASSQDRTVDFRYAPSRYLTAICFPDDWQKTLVSERGGLSYDFGPGPYSQPLTEITLGVQGLNLPVRSQSLADPRVPVVTTVLDSGSIHVEEQAFAIVTGHEGALLPGSTGRVHRIGGVSGTSAWGRPAPGVDTAFRSVAWGTGRPIVYHVDVPKGSRWNVVLGFIEPHKWKPGLRLIEARVEGADPITVDPLRDSVRNRPYVYSFEARDVNGDGELSIEVHPSPKTPDANVTLSCFWVFPAGTNLDGDALIRGELSEKAEVYYACGQELERSARYPRLDGLLASIGGTDRAAVVSIRSRRHLEFDPQTGLVLAGGRPFLLTRPRPVGAARTGDTLLVTLPPETKHVEVIVAHGPAAPTNLERIPRLSREIERSSEYWRALKSLPYDVIRVPDPGIQSVLDASIRNLYQVAEAVDGNLQFQPGPTVYRGLWAGDVLLSGMPILMLGDNESEKRFLETALAHQLPDGRVCSIEPFLSIPETPVVLTAACLYAQFTGDTSWIRTHWSSVHKGLSWVCMMHRRALADTASAWYGMMPPGFVDGGVFNETADYASVWWSLIALDRAGSMARRLRLPRDPQWQPVYDEMANQVRRTSARDMRTDLHGNPYLPIAVADTDRANAPRGQFAFLIPFRWGRFFQDDTAFSRPARSTLAMLDASEEEGLVLNSGWLKGGVWPWLGGIDGMAHAMLGDERRAEDLLYAVANHAAPTGIWVEEQQARSYGSGTAGDVSDAEASAVFVSQVRDMIMQERGDTLHLFDAIPGGWLSPGATIALTNAGSLYGPVTATLTIAGDGRSGELSMFPVDGHGSRGEVVLHFGALSRAGYRTETGRLIPESISIPWKEAFHLSFLKM